MVDKESVRLIHLGQLERALRAMLNARDVPEKERHCAAVWNELAFLFEISNDPAAAAEARRMAVYYVATLDRA